MHVDVHCCDGPSGLSLQHGHTDASVDALRGRCEALRTSQYRRLRLSIGASRSIGDLRRSMANAWQRVASFEGRSPEGLLSMDCGRMSLYSFYGSESREVFSLQS